MAAIGASHVLHESTAVGTALLISLPSLADDALETMLRKCRQAFAETEIVVATPDDVPPEVHSSGLRVVSYAPAVSSSISWTLTAADFVNAHELRSSHGAGAILLLGAEAESLEPSALCALADSVLQDGTDLAVSRYSLPPRSGLVNSAILYPVSRALFGAAPRYPLAIDLCLSARMTERLATVAQRSTAANQPDALIWPVSEAAVASYSIAQVEVGSRALPRPAAPDLNALLAHVASSLFADVDAKATFWQRARVAQTSKLANSSIGTAVTTTDEVEQMLEAFRLAYGNLAEIWSLVLPPQSLLGIKRLSVMPPASFSMSDSLWARIVYDFLLAYRLRTINRGHLLGALTPLYLAWVASHIVGTRGGKDAEARIEALAAAFETDKPYLVSRWRWPDRFNP